MKNTANRRPSPAERPELRQRAEALRSSLPQLSVATPSAPHQFGTTVEAYLVALNEQYETYVAVLDRTGAMNDGWDAEPISKKAIELATAHALRVKRRIFATALALPASSIVALGLQARLIVSETPDWFDGNDIDASEEACRGLLIRLISLANLKPIARPDVTPDELHRWLDDPETQPSGSRYDEECAK